MPGRKYCESTPFSAGRHSTPYCGVDFAPEIVRNEHAAWCHYGCTLIDDFGGNSTHIRCGVAPRGDGVDSQYLRPGIQLQNVAVLFGPQFQIPDTPIIDQNKGRNLSP